MPTANEDHAINQEILNQFEKHPSIPEPCSDSLKSRLDVLTAKLGAAQCSLDQEIVANKGLRKSIDADIQALKLLPSSRERALAITKLQEGVMWLGMDLKRINEISEVKAPNPYPNSYDPSNTKIEPTADGLKL